MFSNHLILLSVSVHLLSVCSSLSIRLLLLNLFSDVFLDSLSSILAAADRGDDHKHDREDAAADDTKWDTDSQADNVRAFLVILALILVSRGVECAKFSVKIIIAIRANCCSLARALLTRRASFCRAAVRFTLPPMLTRLTIWRVYLESA